MAAYQDACSPQVLCSVDSVPAVLDEARRVLRHGAPFVFIEHVVAPPGRPLLRTAQARPSCCAPGAACPTL